MAQRPPGELHVDPSDRVTPSADAPAPRRGHRAGGAPPGRKPPAGGARSPRRTPKPRRRWLGRFARWGFVGAVWAVLILGGIIGYFALTLPPINDLAVADRRPSVTLLAADGSLLATFGDLFGQPVHLKDLPAYVPAAVLATEDRRFYHHYGIDPVGLVRALVVNARAGHVVQGGSTLTQQLAKNLFLTPDRTVRRKIQECLLALWLEHKFSKDQILEIYLNRVYLGAGSYGVDAAAERYFSKPARELTVYEAAVIAGLLKAPTRFSPARDQARAAERAHQVLANMVDAGYLTDAQAQAAAAQKTELATAARVRPGSRYFADWVASQLASLHFQDRDVVIATTLDARLQVAAEQAIDDTLDRDGDKDDVEEGALLTLATDGAVRAMVGGRDYGDSQFNRVTQAQRQPGSSFKPMVYLTALEHGISPNDHFIDQPVRFGKWEPHNYEGKFRGDVTVAEAVAHSINTVAAQVLRRAGIDNVIATAHRLGITSELARNDSLALGTSVVTLMDLTTAYTTFATGGIGVWPYGIVEIRDTGGHVLWRREGSGPGRLIDAHYAGEMNDMLTGVLDHGTGKSARLDRPAAGKTGTTQDFRDALFVGYTADLVTGVWFGNDDYSPMKHVTGGSLPAETWHAYMLQATTGMPVRPLPGPGEEAEVATAAAAAPAEAPAEPEDEGALARLIHSILGEDKPAGETER